MSNPIENISINKKIKMPCQAIWTHQYALSNVNFEDDKKYCVIYTDISACRTDVRYLKLLSKKKNIVMIMVMANVVASKEKLLKQRFDFFKHIFTWDKSDAERYGMILHSTYYSRIKMPAQINLKSDCFFIGSAKGRLEILHKLYKRVTEAGGRADFYITNVNKKDQTESGIFYNKSLSYNRVLANDMSTNCVIEVLAGDQVGQTLRSEEAIIGNKKLLTNNASMRNNPYYKTGYIRIFDEITDEDIRFVMRKEKVNYEYNDDYSPIYLIDHINEIESKE